ncbi:MAG: hypothetical protein KDD45_09205 [Bdellovibrionales bacterium]|nr:hypothetical protein [Bdellovibrionales bacterium]
MKQRLKVSKILNLFSKRKSPYYNKSHYSLRSHDYKVVKPDLKLFNEFLFSGKSNCIKKLTTAIEEVQAYGLCGIYLRIDHDILKKHNQSILALFNQNLPCKLFLELKINKNSFRDQSLICSIVKSNIYFKLNKNPVLFVCTEKSVDFDIFSSTIKSLNDKLTLGLSSSSASQKPTNVTDISLVNPYEKIEHIQFLIKRYLKENNTLEKIKLQNQIKSLVQSSSTDEHLKIFNFSYSLHQNNLSHESLKFFSYLLRQAHNKSTHVGVVSLPSIPAYRYAMLEEMHLLLNAFDPAKANLLFSTQKKEKCSETIAILHIYYLDLIEEIKHYLENLDSFDLIVTIPDHFNIEEVKSIIKSFPTAKIFQFENRGRDIFPFMQILPQIENQYRYGIKIHSKKSLRSEKGDLDRKLLFENLLGSKQAIEQAREALDSGFNIFAPKEYLLNCDKHIGSNLSYVNDLLNKLHVENNSLDFKFPAGSFYWFRPESFKRFTSLGLKESDFDIELGQIDGTLAHGIERVILAGTNSNFLLNSEYEK